VSELASDVAPDQGGSPRHDGRGNAEPDGRGVAKDVAKDVAKGEPKGEAQGDAKGDAGPRSGAGRQDTPAASEVTDADADDASPPKEDPASRLRDRERTRETADYARILDERTIGLVGDVGAGGFGQSTVHIYAGPIYGDVVGGAKYGGAESRALLGEIVVGEVTTTVLGGLRRSFVAPACADGLRAMLHERGVAVLDAPTGWGRTTTGVCLLDELCEAGVSKLETDTDLRKLDPKHLKDGFGYLLEVRSDDQLLRVRVPHLEALGAACLGRGIRLLVTTEAGAHLRADVHGEFGVRGGHRPDRAAVLEHHLVVHLADLDPANGRVPLASHAPAAVREAARAVLSSADTIELLDPCVDDSFSMRRLARLAGRLTQLPSEGTKVDDIRAELTAESRQGIEQWLGGEPDLARYSLRIALAVLNGMSSFTVTRAAVLLEDMLREVAQGDGDDEPRPVFSVSRAQRLDDARAEAFPTREVTPFGTTSVEGMRYRHAGYPLAVLAWAWREHDVARDVMLDWLGRLGGDRDRRIRIAAATATGHFATFEFEWARRALLTPWAEQTDPLQRESAAAALRLPAMRPELSGLVLEMLRGWLHPDENPYRRWTAVRALGASVGRSFMDEAIKLLRKVAKDEDPFFVIAVYESMTELFVTADEQATSKVLHALTRWSGSRAPAARRRTAIFCFLMIAFQTTIDDPVDGARWPSLVWLAETDVVAGQRVALLWRRALRMAGLAGVARAVVDDWVERATESPVVIDPLGRLVQRTIVEPYDRDCFHQALTRLHEQDKKTDMAETAGSLLQVLAETKKDQ
jgi:hypothetical protein